jgi:hypothetical protein
VVAQLLDARGDEVGFDAVLERLDLNLEPAVGIGELLPDPRRAELGVALALAAVVAQLLAEAMIRIGPRSAGRGNALRA